MLAGVFAALALLLLILPGQWRSQLADGIRGTVLRPVTALQRGALERDLRLADPSRLRAERDSLAAYLVDTAGLLAENQQLRSLLGLQQRLPATFLPAEVVRVPSRAMDGIFRLTAGARDGVAAGAPIVGASGLIGMVRSVDQNGAVGIDWTNADFRASAMTADGDIFGIVEPRRGPGGEPMLALTGAAFHAELAENTLIVTSGRGGVYPRGIPIGVVAGVDEEEGGWQRSYLVRPTVSPAEMAYVLVLGPRDPSLMGRDLAASWGITVTEPAAVDTTQLGAEPPPLTAPAPRAPAQPAQQQPALLGRPIQPGAAPANPDTATQPGGTG